MWPTRSAAFQPGQSCAGRDQSDCATVRRSCPSAAVTVRMSSSDTAVCLSLGAGTADKPVPGSQGGGERRGRFGGPRQAARTIVSTLSRLTALGRRQRSWFHQAVVRPLSAAKIAP
jgi:hypothetical protein